MAVAVKPRNRVSGAPTGAGLDGDGCRAILFLSRECCDHRALSDRSSTEFYTLPNEEAVLLLLFGLLRSGQIKLRRLVGWQELESAGKSAKAA